LLAESYLLYMYRTYVNQMNLNGKLRKKLGAKQGAKQKSGRAMAHPGPPLESPLAQERSFRRGKVRQKVENIGKACRLHGKVQEKSMKER